MAYTQIDTGFLRSRFSGVYAFQFEDGYAVVEVGSTLSVPAIVSYFTSKNIPLEKVVAVFVTHAHLDHMGGAGLLLQSLPQAKCYCHPAAAPHVADPLSKLAAAAIEVYGREVFDKDYPNLQKIEPERVVSVQDDEIILQQFQCIHTAGHAFHHCMWYHLPSKTLFSGDGLGFGFKEINMCPLLCTSPSQFDVPAWRATVKRC